MTEPLAIEVSTRDEHRLAARFFTPAGPATAAVLVAPAVGVEGESVRARYAAVRSPLVSISFTDDEYMSARNTASLHGLYSGAPQVARRISPADAGVARIGHFGFFRGKFAEPLWRRYLLPELVGRAH